MQLLTDCENPEHLFASNDWAAEEKLDGQRMMLYKQGNVLTAHSRSGRPMTIPDTVLAVAMLSPDSWIIDGELYKGEFYAFDLVKWNQQGGARSYSERHVWLRAMSPFKLVRRAIGEAAKRALCALVKEDGGEGIVFKRLAAHYRANERHADWQRHKFYESDDFEVAEVDIAKCSVFVSRNGKNYGKVACHLNSLPMKGDTIRVRYDGITAAGKLLRPRRVKA